MDHDARGALPRPVYAPARPVPMHDPARAPPVHDLAPAKRLPLIIDLTSVLSWTGWATGAHRRSHDTGERRTSFADVSAHVSAISAWGSAGGGFCDVLDGVGPVALKKLRMHAARFRHEADTWCRLDHRHVLPFFGLCVDGPALYMCSPWQDRGDLPHFLREHPDADRLALTADALSYLHANGIVHGDIKGVRALSSSVPLVFAATTTTTTTSSSSITTSSFSRRAACYRLPRRVLPATAPRATGCHAPGHAAPAFPPAPRGRAGAPRGTHEEALWLLAERCWGAHPAERCWRVHPATRPASADPATRPASADAHAFLRWCARAGQGEQVAGEEEPLLWRLVAPRVGARERVAPLPRVAQGQSAPRRASAGDTARRLQRTLARDTQFARLRRALVGLVALDTLIALLAVVQAVFAGLLCARGAAWPLALAAAAWTAAAYAPLCAFQLAALVFLRGVRLSRLFTVRMRLAYAVVACALLSAAAGVVAAQVPSGDSNLGGGSEGGNSGRRDTVLLTVYKGSSAVCSLAWSLVGLTGVDAGCQALRMWGVLLVVPASTETALSRSYVLSA
ncbi:hypothetical protein HDZ31DRAFT_61349 [Schizophyllum fasciatum]